ncbi:hypothetical protein ACKKBG_A19030 [Auxenochlorella protothecoides x Auxenochlorella symbiontica]
MRCFQDLSATTSRSRNQGLCGSLQSGAFTSIRPPRYSGTALRHASSCPRQQTVCASIGGSARTALAATLMALSIHSGAPAWAELATVPPETALQAARPLPQQPIDKGRIWFVLIVGASALFGATVLLENRAAWFPAIAKANQAMKSAATASSRNGEALPQEGPEGASPVPLDRSGHEAGAITGAAGGEGEPLDTAVLEGLREGRQKALRGSEETVADAADR